MAPQALLGQAEGAESVGYERRVYPPRVLLRQIRQRVEVGLSLVMVSGRSKVARHLEHREDGRGWIPALALVRSLVEVLAKEVSVSPAVWMALPVSWSSSKWKDETWSSMKSLLRPISRRYPSRHLRQPLVSCCCGQVASWGSQVMQRHLMVRAWAGRRFLQTYGSEQEPLPLPRPPRL